MVNYFSIFDQCKGNTGNSIILLITLDEIIYLAAFSGEKSRRIPFSGSRSGTGDPETVISGAVTPFVVFASVVTGLSWLLE
jgi:hypothetical protein